MKLTSTDELSSAHSTVEEILDERVRQMKIEGWSHAHDDSHDQGEMARAAACYAMFPGHHVEQKQPPEQWPWSLKCWKPKDERRNLIRAAALLVAEIERLDRIPE